MPPVHASELGGIIRFDTPADFFEAMHGPAQRDAHVKAYRSRQANLHWLAAADGANASVEEWMAEQREASAQRVAEDHGFDVPSIDCAIARWSVGGEFAHIDNAPTRLRQLRRAREIAAARNITLIAAE